MFSPGINLELAQLSLRTISKTLTFTSYFFSTSKQHIQKLQGLIILDRVQQEMSETIRLTLRTSVVAKKLNFKSELYLL